MEKQFNTSAFCRFMSNLFGVSLFVFDEAGLVTERYVQSPDNAELLLDFLRLKERIQTLCREARRPQVVSSELNQLWAGIPYVADDSSTRTIIVGPVYTTGGSTTLMLEYLRPYHLSASLREQLLDALNHSPICTYTEYARLIAIIHAFLYGEELDTSELPIAGLTQSAPGNREPKAEEKPGTRDTTSLDPTSSLELRLLECIQEGNLAKLQRLLKTSNYSSIHRLSLPDPVRQQKDMFVGLISQVVSATIRAGLNAEVAYSLHDRYIQRMEAMAHVLPIITLTREMLYDYTQRVGRLRRTTQYSKFINDCCNFIDAHVYENLRVTQVAEHTGHNAHYLSERFRQETGQTLGDYIRQAKIAEAKSLLRYSTLSLADISEQLAFSSQSFFTSTFRSVAGTTPGAYRKSIQTS